MPRASGEAGVTLGAAPASEIVFHAASDGGPCTTFAVRCRAEAENPALVSIKGLHGDAWLPIPPGETQHFRRGTRTVFTGIHEVRVKGSGGDTIVDYWVAADGVR